MKQIKSTALAYQQIPAYMKEHAPFSKPKTISEITERFADLSDKQQVYDIIRKHEKAGDIASMREGRQKVYWWKRQENVEPVRAVAAEVVQAKPDMVNQPPHYTSGGIETIDYMRAKMTPEEYRGFLKGNAIKYLSRAEMKGGAEDYKKAQWYINKLVEAGEA